jgi:hypothetical protein
MVLHQYSLLGHTRQTLACRPDSHASLLVRPINALHLSNRLLTIQPHPTPFPPLDPIHKPLQHIPVRRPPILTLALALRPNIRLLTLRDLLRSQHLAVLSPIRCHRVDINAVPNMGAHEAMELERLLRRNLHVVFHAVFLAQRHAQKRRQPRRSRVRPTVEQPRQPRAAALDARAEVAREGPLAAVGKRVRGVHGQVAAVIVRRRHQLRRRGVDGYGVCVEHAAERAQIVRAQVEHGAAGEVEFEADVIGWEEACGHGGDGAGFVDVGGVEEREECVPCRVELVVACFEEDWGFWGGEHGVVEEGTGFFGVAGCRLLDENVFSGFEGFECPFVV